MISPDKIKQLEKYVMEGAAAYHITELLSKINSEINQNSFEDKENYQRLMKIIDFLFKVSMTPPPKKEEKKKNKLDFISKN